MKNCFQRNQTNMYVYFSTFSTKHRKNMFDIHRRISFFRLCGKTSFYLFVMREQRSKLKKVAAARCLPSREKNNKQNNMLNRLYSSLGDTSVFRWEWAREVIKMRKYETFQDRCFDGWCAHRALKKWTEQTYTRSVTAAEGGTFWTSCLCGCRARILSLSLCSIFIPADDEKWRTHRAAICTKNAQMPCGKNLLKIQVTDHKAPRTTTVSLTNALRMSSSSS